jgi:hypothetical protein
MKEASTVSRHPKNGFQSPAAAAATLALLAGSLAGCGSMTSAPLATETVSSAGTGAVSLHGGRQALPEDDPMVGESPTPPEAVIDMTQVLAPFTPGGPHEGGPLVNGAEMEGAVGGKVKNGRWTITMPAESFEGGARVELSIPASKAWGCELNIFPAEKNHFETQATLSVDCHNIPPPRLADLVILYFNPDTFLWEPVEGSTVDMRKKTVSAPLSHFSIYALGTTDGRAGW